MNLVKKTLLTLAIGTAFASCSSDIKCEGTTATKGTNADEWTMNKDKKTLNHHFGTAKLGKVTYTDETFTFESAQKNPQAKEVLQELQTAMRTDSISKKNPVPGAGY